MGRHVGARLRWLAVHGLVVVGAAGLTRAPSQHYGAHFIAASRALQQFAKDFIDGAVAIPTELVEVIPFEEEPEYARVGLVDLAEFEKRAFVVALWSRSAHDLASTPRNCDARGTPSLLAEIRSGGGWQLHNCCLTLVSWDRDRLFRGDYPPT